MGEPQQSTDPEPELEEVPEAPPAKPGFSTKFFEKLASVGGFYGTPLEVELGLERVIPAEFMLHAHHWLILHGRYTCLARKPRCEVCLINDLCRWPEKTV